ncbi:transcriptional regulator, MarR family [Ruminiclostridium papyrosolvens DSM 2782]|uniref:HTH-type transcriptional regulator SarZ n=1 Tax=Ruminiclostridium papyrosolvens DSM 2782 TaxID=588581 RepID=F1TAG7_9FIRM|nr:MarR family transcriptional regulator [Ruminiclostridium papyrosolvens]EGD48510.1 transcriptional regulator, MarR family [Ruminiclostridium papyrosolvens DSM 2782]WES32732.1 MarR family transcriptional regulator [Ruminiclostridium papyrosolvens DSM 2782]
MNSETENSLLIVDELFRKLIDKYNKLESKKFFSKTLDDLTVIEINTLVVIGHGEEDKRMSEIANSLGVTFGTPTVTVDRLIKKGYVIRRRDNEDRRQVFISLSDTGKDVFESIIIIRNILAEKIYGILSEDERKALINILSSLDSHFDDIFSFRNK